MNKPTIAEIQEYAKSINFNLDAEYFYHYYEAIGWKRAVGKVLVPISNWKSVVQTWKRSRLNAKTTRAASTDSLDPLQIAERNMR